MDLTFFPVFLGGVLSSFTQNWQDTRLAFPTLCRDGPTRYGQKSPICVSYRERFSDDTRLVQLCSKWIWTRLPSSDSGPPVKRLLRGYTKYRCCYVRGVTAGVRCTQVVSVTDWQDFGKSGFLVTPSGEIRRTGLCWCTFFHLEPFACQSFCMKIGLGSD